LSAGGNHLEPGIVIAMEKRLALLVLFLLTQQGSIARTQVSGQASTQSSLEKKTAGLMTQGMNLAAGGQFAQAEVILEQARAGAPHSAEVLTALAKVKGRSGDLPGAIALFREVVDATPRSTDAHLNLALALADNSDFDSALLEASKAVELSPKLALAHLNRARILADGHRPDDAITEFAIAARLAPTNADCFYYWALVEKEKFDYAKESDLLRTVVRLQPRNEKALNLLGESLMNEAKDAEAIAVWRKLLAVDPESSEATYSLSQALRGAAPEESKQLLTRYRALLLREKQLKQVNTLGNQAYLAINNRRWQEAIESLREAIGLCADCSMQASLHKDLGLALCNSGDIHAGEAELRIALRLDPKDRDTLRALASISHQ
jgi:tetratricopeptide (TPR) repeat protein